MKKKTWCLVLAASMLFCTACGKKTETPAESEKRTEEIAQIVPAEQTETTPETVQEQGVDDIARFVPVLDAISDAIYNGVDYNDENPFVPTGIIELVEQMTGEEVSETVGFTFLDLNGDGENEMLVAEDETDVIGGFSVVNGEPDCFLDGWSRNRYFLIDDNRLFNQGSGGAAYAIFGVYRLSADGTELVCEDCYFTDIKEGTEDQIAFFHNTTGEWDAAASEPFEGTEDDFWEKSEELWSEPVSLKLTMLSDYDYTGWRNQPKDCKVRLDFEEDVGWRYEEIKAIGDEFPELAPTGEPYEVSVVFYPKENVEDFKLLRLQLLTVDDKGNPSFGVTELCALPTLNADEPVSVTMSFPGDMPAYGFSYRENGAEQQFSVSQSGRDGKLVVAPISPV